MFDKKKKQKQIGIEYDRDFEIIRILRFEMFFDGAY